MTYRSLPKFNQLCVLALLVGAAWCAMERLGRAVGTGHMPLTPAELAHRVKMQQVSLKFEPGVLEVSGVKIEIKSGGDYNLAVFSGQDKAGKPWICWAWVGALEGALYTADLNNDGSRDMIFVSSTAGNGWAPSSQILTLVFEPSGRPLVTTFDGYFAYDASGVKDMVDFAGDGRTALVRQSFDDGYWVTSLYTLENRRWKRAHGRVGGRTFPLYTRFTTADNHTTTIPTRGRHPREDDMSTASADWGAVRIEDIKWSEREQSLTVVLSGGRRCDATNGLVIIDTTDGRQAATGVAQVERRKLFERAKADSLLVTPFGAIASRNHDAAQPACAPDSIWAQEAPN